jgi:hypothetical protein
MAVLSNQCFWDELPRELNRLVPHLEPADQKAYAMLLRLMQAIIFSKSSTSSTEEDTNFGQDDRITYYPWEKKIFYTTWSNCVSGIDFEVERICAGMPSNNLDNTCFVVTTEFWEAKIKFKYDERAANEHHYGNVPYFLMRPVMLESIEIEGSIAEMCQNMFIVALTISLVENGEVFYRGSPI